MSVSSLLAKVCKSLESVCRPPALVTMIAASEAIMLINNNSDVVSGLSVSFK